MKRILTLLVLFFTALVANATDNVLQSVQIDSVGDTYNIILKTTSEAQIKKTTQASNKIILNLNDIRASKTINTIYNNATNVDSVMIEPVGDNAVNVIIQADNVSNAAITFDSSDAIKLSSTAKSVALAKKAKKEHKDKIVLSHPIKSYVPIYNEEDIDLDEEETPNAIGFLEGVKKLFSEGNISNIMTTGLIGVILFCGIKLFRKEEPEQKIGLAQSLKDREIDLYKEITARRGVVGPISKDTTLNMPQVRPNAGYGIKAYQSEAKSPYMTSEIITKKPLTPPVSPAYRPMAAATTQRRPDNFTVNRPVQNMAVSQPELKPSNIDSMKFLESMTKIYEKNGRADLAQGLKSSMVKAQSRM